MNTEVTEKSAIDEAREMLAYPDMLVDAKASRRIIEALLVKAVHVDDLCTLVDGLLPMMDIEARSSESWKGAAALSRLTLGRVK